MHVHSRTRKHRVKKLEDPYSGLNTILGNVTSAGWQVTLYDPIWDVSSRSGEACC